MSLPRSTLMTWAQQQSDAVSSSRWSSDEIRQALGAAHEEEWSRILNAAPYTRAALRTVTSDASGQVAVASLDGGSGDTAERFYRILSWDDGQRLYEAIQYQDAPLARVASSMANIGPYMYYLFGDVFQVAPPAANVSFTVAVNHKPQNAALLADDSKSVVFPSGRELLLAIAAAQFMLRSKGGAEADGALALEPSAQLLRQGMLDDLARRTVGAQVMRFPDRAQDWGG